MSAANLIIESPKGDRALVHPDSLHDWLQRGYTALGPAAEGAPTILTVQEWESILDARQETVKALLGPRKSKSAQTPKEGRDA